MPLTDLSDEVIVRILSFVDHQDVKSATQIKVLQRPATQILFANLKCPIFTDDLFPGFGNLQIVAEDMDLAKLVGALRLQPRLRLHQDFNSSAQGYALGLLEHAFSLTHQFPFLQSMALDISNLGRRNTTLSLNGHAAQAMPFRVILQMLQSIASRPYKCSDIKSLELTGIASVSVPVVTSSQAVCKVMGKLKHLRLGFDDWYDISNTQTAIMDTPIHAASHSFMKSIVLSWLDKSCSTLETLIIEFREYAGVYPPLNFGWLQFKCLTRIELLGLAIMSADIIDHIFDLSDCIKFLYLIDCPIIPRMETWMDVDNNLYPMHRQNQPWTAIFEIPFRYYIVFEKLYNEWPNLVEFGFSSAATSYPRPYVFEGNLSPYRYKHYLCGAIVSNAATYQLHEAVTGRDAAALARLYTKYNQLGEAKAVRDAHYWDPGYQEYEPEGTANDQVQEAKEITMTEEAESENTDTSNSISSNTSNHNEETITTPRALTGPGLA